MQYFVTIMYPNLKKVLKYFNLVRGWEGWDLGYNLCEFPIDNKRGRNKCVIAT